MSLSELLSDLGDTVRSGDKIRSVVTARRMNAIIGAIRALARGDNIIGGPGVRVKTASSAGMVLIGVGRTDATLSIEHPFLVSDSSSSTAASVKVKSGSVNDVIPSNISPTALTMSSAGTWRVYLDCTLSDDAAGGVTAATLAVTSGAQPANTRTHAYITLATVPVTAVDGGFAAGEISQLATHSLRFYACGRTESEDGSYNFWGF